MIGAEALDEVLEHPGIEGDGVEVELFQRAGRLFLQHRAAVGARLPGVVHARPVVREVAAGVRQHDFELRMALHHAVEDQVARRHRGLERIADHVVEVVVHQPLALREADGMHENDCVQLFRSGKEFFK